MTVSNDDAPSASRGPPAMVAPVTIAGITYRGVAGNAKLDGQAGGWLGAFTADGTLLWTVKVYDNQRHGDLEGDVQDVYFSEMTLLADGTIRIINEDGKRFRFDPQSQRVTSLPSRAPATDEDDAIRPTRPVD